MNISDEAGDPSQPSDQPGNREDPTVILVPAPVLLSNTMFIEAKLRETDTLLQNWTLTDKTLRLCLGDTLHPNNRTHLTRNVEGYEDR